MYIEEYIKEAIENKKVVIIQNKKSGKYFEVIALEVREKKLFYLFSSSKINGEIFLFNIASISFKSQEEDKKFKKKLADSNFGDYKKYYLSRIEKDTEIELKKELFTLIFEQLIDPTNLLYKYLKNDCSGNEIFENKVDIPLLIDQSNISQKKAIINSLSSKISFIEGPPGTGKTTTILSLIANLICQNKQVIVVSKNNSAVNNIIEEYEKSGLDPFYVRFGRKEIMETFEENAGSLLQKLKNNYCASEDLLNAKLDLENIKLKLEIKEKELENCMKSIGLLNELKNQKRYIDKREDTYHFSDILSDKEKKFLRPRGNLIKDINRTLSLIRKKNYRFLDKFLIKYRYHLEKENTLEKLVALNNILENLYLNNELAKLDEIHLKQDTEDLKEEIKNLYRVYVEICKKYFVHCLSKNIADKYEKYGNSNYSWKTKFKLICPLILTTADAFLFNFKDYIKYNKKIDCIIIDEATQCDVITGLPLLYLAEQIVVVGDSKQLSAIINDKVDTKYEVDDIHQQENNNFLKSMKSIFNFKPILLKEHYRCDYNIIDFCNKYYYDNELLIYTTSSYDSMQIVNVGSQKACMLEGKSFYNEREIISLEGLTQNEKIDQCFFITPFTLQGEKLKSKFGTEISGTIHTFQGKGNDYVYFDTVLNDLNECKNHLKGAHNMFTKELVNVAVSRAKKKFVLVTDVSFFKKYQAYCSEVKHIMDYIELYGKEVRDNTVCLFDGLYQSISGYTTGIYDSSFEEILDVKFISILNKYTNYGRYLKVPLVKLVNDKKFLDQNIELKSFIMNGAHVDYLFYDKRIGKPVLAVELDGKEHLNPVQKERDCKKEKILNHIGLPLLRVSSKSVLKIENIEAELSKYFD